MKKYLVCLLAAITGLLIISIIISGRTIKSLYKDKVTISNNYAVLLEEHETVLSENQKYKIQDSLNAVRLTELELSIAQFKKYRADDAKLISSLNIKNKELEKVISSQTETINTLSIPLKDSTVTSIDSIKTFEYKSKWTDVRGNIDLNSDLLNVYITNREALTIIESVQYKRFLGFLWKTKRIERNKVDVISKNPNTQIVDVDVIGIMQ